jgi:hypothetical protein
VKKFIRIGVDLEKNYFQVHALVSDVGPPAPSTTGRARTIMESGTVSHLTLKVRTRPVRRP